MRAVVQRVRGARVEVAGETVGEIQRGLLVYLAFGQGDTPAVRSWMIGKIASLRVFDDETGPSAAVPTGMARRSGERPTAEASAPPSKKMTRNVAEAGGAVLLVSQFTLYGDVRRGRRPSFDRAMPPEQARMAYEAAVGELRQLGVPVATGRFRAEMLVTAINDGPVTLWLDSAVDAPQGLDAQQAVDAQRAADAPHAVDSIGGAGGRDRE